MADFAIFPTTPKDKNWIEQFITDHWGTSSVVAHGTVYHPHELAGFMALAEGEGVGLLTYAIDGESCEIVTINSTAPGLGIGTALLNAVKQKAVECGCKQLWLITTNDNMESRLSPQNQKNPFKPLYGKLN